MRSNRISAWLMIFMSEFVCSTLLAASPGFIKGKVSDSEGSAIAEAHVIFHADLAGRSNRMAILDQSRETDAAGRFNIQLEPGFYDVCVTAMAFTPICKKVLVTSSKTSEHDVKLKADPLVSEHLADTF
jgi:hypothetical protein